MRCVMWAGLAATLSACGGGSPTPADAAATLDAGLDAGPLVTNGGLENDVTSLDDMLDLSSTLPAELAAFEKLYIGYRSYDRDGQPTQASAVVVRPEDLGLVDGIVVFAHGVSGDSYGVECAPDIKVVTVAQQALAAGHHFLVIGVDYHGGMPVYPDGTPRTVPEQCDRSIANSPDKVPDFHRTRMSDVYNAMLVARDQLCPSCPAGVPITLWGHDYGAAFVVRTLARLGELGKLGTGAAQLNVTHLVVQAGVWDDGARLAGEAAALPAGDSVCPVEAPDGTTCTFSGDDGVPATMKLTRQPCFFAQIELGGVTDAQARRDQACAVFVDQAPSRHTVGGVTVAYHQGLGVPTFIALGDDTLDLVTPSATQGAAMGADFGTHAIPRCSKLYAGANHDFAGFQVIFVDDLVRFVTGGAVAGGSGDCDL